MSSIQWAGEDDAATSIRLRGRSVSTFAHFPTLIQPLQWKSRSSASSFAVTIWNEKILHHSLIKRPSVNSFSFLQPNQVYFVLRPFEGTCFNSIFFLTMSATGWRVITSSQYAACQRDNAWFSHPNHRLTPHYICMKVHMYNTKGFDYSSTGGVIIRLSGCVIIRPPTAVIIRNFSAGLHRHKLPSGQSRQDLTVNQRAT